MIATLVGAAVVVLALALWKLRVVLALLFGGFAVLLAVPFAALMATLVEVTVLDRDPSKAEVPTVLFPAKDAEQR